MSTPDDSLLLRPLAPATRVVAAVLLLVFGVQVWLVVKPHYGYSVQRTALPVALLLVCIPPINRLIRRGIAALDASVLLRPWTWSAALAVLSFAYLYNIAIWEGRPIVPRIHDEWQFLLQARFLANFRLWMPPHPIADFFDTFYVLRKPVYAPQSFPGWPLMMVPATWLNLPYWATPMAVMIGVILLGFRLVATALGGAAALVGVLLLLSAWGVRTFAIAPMAHAPTQLLGLLIIASYWRWRSVDQGRRWRWAVAIGIFAGWAAITRPLDGLCYALPVGVSMLADLWRQPAVLPAIVRTGALVVLGALPLLTLQLVFNKGVTGSFTKTPFALYNEIDQPSLAFLAQGTGGQPQTLLPQKHYLYREMMLRSINDYRTTTVWQRMNKTISGGFVDSQLPHPLVLIVIPCMLLAVGRNRAWLLVTPAILFLFAYAWYPIGGPHYSTAVVVGCAAAVLLGVEGFSRGFGARDQAVRAGGLVLVGTLAVTSCPPLDPYVLDEMARPADMAQIQQLVAELPPNSIVLFVPDPVLSYSEEPVYNLDVVWPDDARVIRAQDLGDRRNGELFRYYARTQPTRVIYRYVRSPALLTRLGTARELADAGSVPADAAPATGPTITTTAQDQGAQQP